MDRYMHGRIALSEAAGMWKSRKSHHKWRGIGGQTSLHKRSNFAILSFLLLQGSTIDQTTLVLGKKKREVDANNRDLCTLSALRISLYEAE